jgi:hypothetical protein
VEALRLNKTAGNTSDTSSDHRQLPTLSRLLTANSPAANDPARQYAEQLSRHTRNIVEKRLRENFPLIFTVLHSTYLIAAAIVVIVLQVILVTKKADYSYILNGVWAGLAALALAVGCVVLSKNFIFKNLF